MKRLWQRAQERLDAFLFQSCDPRLVPLLRIAYAALLIVYTLVWLRDGEVWFGDAGVLSQETAQELGGGRRWSLLFELPGTAPVIYGCLSVLLVQAVLLLIGCWSRFQMACIFAWLVSFQHRNPLICDGEDTVFRMFAFLMIFLPLDCGWSLARRLSRRPLPKATPADAWALRLIQLQMTIIYASAAWTKLHGASWRDGTALYIVSHMADHFGRWPGLSAWYDSMWLVQLQTWGVVAIEIFLPIALWLKPTRRLAIAVGIALHLAIEASMNLFLFEWIMIVGLLAFVRLSKAQVRQKYDLSGTEYLTPMSGVSTTSPPLSSESTAAMTMPEVSNVRSIG
ncbi:MAG: HTTM domain-containing protein [Aureliella sp.]